MLVTGSARLLGRSRQEAVADVLAADPVGACLVAARFERAGMDRAGLGGHFWGVDGGRSAVVFDGANLIPLSGDDDAMRRVAQVLGRRGRNCASMLGRAGLVLPLWEALAAGWGPAREIRPDQPLLALHGRPQVAADPLVRRVRPEQLWSYFPAAVAMFTEEVGVDPRRPDDGAAYRRRVASLIDGGFAFARYDGDRVLAKAEIGALSRHVALIQGVWVDPAHRGRGLARSLMGTMVHHIHSLGRIPSLYVNAHNRPARAVYEKVGFTQVGTFATVLF